MPKIQSQLTSIRTFDDRATLAQMVVQSVGTDSGGVDSFTGLMVQSLTLASRDLRQRLLLFKNAFRNPASSLLDTVLGHIKESFLNNDNEFSGRMLGRYWPEEARDIFDLQSRLSEFKEHGAPMSAAALRGMIEVNPQVVASLFNDDYASITEREMSVAVESKSRVGDFNWLAGLLDSNQVPLERIPYYKIFQALRKIDAAQADDVIKKFIEKNATSPLIARIRVAASQQSQPVRYDGTHAAFLISVIDSYTALRLYYLLNDSISDEQRLKKGAEEFLDTLPSDQLSNLYKNIYELVTKVSATADQVLMQASNLAKIIDLFENDSGKPTFMQYLLDRQRQEKGEFRNNLVTQFSEANAQKGSGFDPEVMANQFATLLFDDAMVLAPNVEAFLSGAFKVYKDFYGDLGIWGAIDQTLKNKDGLALPKPRQLTADQAAVTMGVPLQKMTEIANDWGRFFQSGVALTPLQRLMVIGQIYNNGNASVLGSNHFENVAERLLASVGFTVKEKLTDSTDSVSHWQVADSNGFEAKAKSGSDGRLTLMRDDEDIVLSPDLSSSWAMLELGVSEDEFDPAFTYFGPTASLAQLAPFSFK